VHPNGVITYNDYAVVKLPSENWGLYHMHNKILIDTYHLRTCAIMCARAYSRTDLNRFFEIKQLDSKYWANFSDNQIYRTNITKSADFSRYIILLNKLEHSQEKADFYRSEISRMFKYTFA
jgi:hypothetical protein